MDQSLPIDHYVSTLSPELRLLVEHAYNIVGETVPSVEQGMSYAMPALLYRGKPLISVMVRQKHLSIYPFSGKVVDKVRDKLGAYDLSSGTIRFTASNPVADALLKDIAMLRRQEIDAATL